MTKLAATNMLVGDIQVREFKCGVTDKTYEERLGATPYRMESFCIQLAYASSNDPNAANPIIPAGNGSPIETAAQTITLFEGTTAGSSVGALIKGSTFVKRNTSNYLAYDSGVAPLNRCFAICGIMVQPRRVYQRFALKGAGVLSSIPVVSSFLAPSQDGFRTAEQVMHDLLETMAITIVEPVSGKFLNLGPANLSPSFLPGLDAYAGVSPALGAYIPLPACIISGSTQTVDAVNILVELAQGQQWQTDGTNIGFGIDKTLNPEGDATVFAEFAVMLIGCAICCPPDKLCTFDGGVTLSEVPGVQKSDPGQAFAAQQ